MKYDNRTLIERFAKPYGNIHKGKCIVRTNISHLIITHSLRIGINTKYFCDSNGHRIFQNSSSSRFNPPKNPEAYIKHFYTKTVEEFCKKINRGDGHYYKNHPIHDAIFNYRIKCFFVYNLITKEKIKIIEKCSGVN